MDAVYLMCFPQDDGCVFFVDEEFVRVRGTLTLVSADNPAANLIAGYKSLTSAFRKCRTCMAVTEDMRTQVCLGITIAMFEHHIVLNL